MNSGLEESGLMHQAITKADTLIEALAWIRRFRDKITVIKLGGSVLEDPEARRHVLLDIVFMETVGMRPVVVHGGGVAISRAMAEAGIEPRFVHGRRYTDAATLEIVRNVLGGEINRGLARDIEKYGGRAMNLSSETSNVLFGKHLKMTDEEGAEIDLGEVGEVTRVDRAVIENLCYAGQVPVIPSICENELGEHLNVNADTAAQAVAESLGAEKLVILSDVNGVRGDKSDPDTLIQSLTASQARQMIQDGSIEAGMIPKIEACLATLQRGVRKIHIIDGQLRHSLLLEIYTSSGIGTQLIPDDPGAPLA